MPRSLRRPPTSLGPVAARSGAVRRKKDSSAAPPGTRHWRAHRASTGSRPFPDRGETIPAQAGWCWRGRSRAGLRWPSGGAEFFQLVQRRLKVSRTIRALWAMPEARPAPAVRASSTAPWAAIWSIHGRRHSRRKAPFEKTACRWSIPRDCHRTMGG